jgi:excisionase family DNA binding protein
VSDLLTTAQAAEILGKSVPTVNRWAAEGVLSPVQKLPGRTGAYLFTRDEIERARDASAGSETVA